MQKVVQTRDARTSEVAAPKMDEKFMPWLSSLVSEGILVKHTFVHVEGLGQGEEAVMNSPLKKKVASLNDLASQALSPREQAPATLSKSASWPTLGPSSEEVFMSSLVNKMFYKQPTKTLATSRSSSFSTTVASSEDEDSGAEWEDSSITSTNTPLLIDTTQDGEPQKLMPTTATTTLTQLPSVGSANHFEGTCRPCCFKLRQRCSLGVRCKHCHFPHEKFQRPGKKTRDRLRRQRQRTPESGQSNTEDERASADDESYEVDDESIEGKLPSGDPSVSSPQTVSSVWTKISF